MGQPDQGLLSRLSDARGNRVVFLSHCLLDENVRYLGGAFHSGATPDVLPLLSGGVGICQMPCPEMRAWGGVHKRSLLRGYGLCDTHLYPLRRILFRLFVLHTRLRYWRLARSVARDIEQYHEAGVTVLGVVGIGGSPSCGVCHTLDLSRSFETVARCPLAQIDRRTINERAVRACRVQGEGMFVHALRKRLAGRRLEIPFLEHDLIAEMDGRTPPLTMPEREAANA